MSSPVERHRQEHRAGDAHIGTHVLCDMWGYDAVIGESSERLAGLVLAAAEAAGAEVLDTVAHEFDPTGVTVLALLAESHISIHTWPQYGYLAIDIFTCGAEMRPERAIELLEQALRPDRSTVQTITRGALEQ